MFEAVLFDMDGVIVDTERSVTSFWQGVADLHGVTLTDEDFRRHVYGRPADGTLDALFPHLTAGERRSIHVLMNEHETNERYSALPGATELLTSLRKHRIPTALVTSGESWKVEAVTGQLGIAALFDATISARDVEVGKPHPDCYLLAARRLGADPTHCLVFEDAVSGVEAATAAGTIPIGIAREDRAPALIEAGARSIIPDFSVVSVRNSTLDLGNGEECRFVGS